MIVLRMSTLVKATPMPKQHPPEHDTWLDEEISSLLEAVGSTANGRRAVPSASPARRRNFSDAIRQLWVELRLRSLTLAYLALAVALGVVIGWLAVMLTAP
jgi:hypothetical protein